MRPIATSEARRRKVASSMGAGSLFPPGIEIGTISEVELEEGSDFYTLTIALGVDMARLNTVLLVKDRMSSEIDSLDQFITQ